MPYNTHCHYHDGHSIRVYILRASKDTILYRAVSALSCIPDSDMYIHKITMCVVLEVLL